MLTAIDQIANQNHLQMFKAIIPYIPQSEQRIFSIYLKMMELQNVTQFFSQHTGTLQACASTERTPQLTDMLKDIRTYCDEEEQKMIDQVTNVLTAMELFTVMSESGEQEADLSYE